MLSACGSQSGSTDAVQLVYFGSGLGPSREPAGALERTPDNQHQILASVNPFKPVPFTQRTRDG
jgi:hypothetical protein